MGEGAWLLGFVTLQRLAELLWARRNDKGLFAAGGVEFARSHYPWMVALHGSWLAGLWVVARDSSVDTVMLFGFGALQAARLWVLVTLGWRWTTRIIVLPTVPAVTKGPYRWLRHPNYLIVAAEIALVPLALDCPVYAALFFVLNGALLAIRVRREDAALAWAIEGGYRGTASAPVGGDLAKPG